MRSSARDSARFRLAAAILAIAVAFACPAPAAAASPARWPVTYVVSDRPGVVPEGIAIHHDGTMYVTSEATGDLYRGDVRRSHLRPLATVARGTSLGVHTDTAGRVFSVGGDQLTVHSRTGRLLDTARAGAGPVGPAQLNDLAVTRDAVYVTDFANPTVYRAERRGGRLGPLEPWLDMSSALPGFPPQFWFLNGIVATAGGTTLLVAGNGTEALWRVDVATRSVEQVDLGGASFGADGMHLDGRTLYAVVNYASPAGVYFVELDAGLRAGRITHTVLTDDSGAAFDSPTTLARYRCRLYVVNSQLDHAPGEPPYTVSAIADPTCTTGP